MDKSASLGTLLHFWGVFEFTQVQPLPSPQKQCWTRVPRIFSEFQLCIGWGEGELQENFEKDALLKEGTENMNIAIPSQGLLSESWFWEKKVCLFFPIFLTLFRHFGDK